MYITINHIIQTRANNINVLDYKSFLYSFISNPLSTRNEDIEKWEIKK
jgi:hypothetical protein